MASVIGRYVPGALCRTWAGTGSLPATSSGSSASSAPSGISPPSQRKLAMKTSWSWATTGPAVRRNRSWKRPSWK